MTIIHAHQNMYPTSPISILFERKLHVGRYHHCTGDNEAPPSLPYYSSFIFRTCRMHAFSLRVPSQQTVNSFKRNQKKIEKLQTPITNFGGNLVLNDKIKDGESSRLPLLQGFYIFQKLFNTFITSVIAIAIEKQKVKKY